jgi:hypothetical protein
MKLLAAVATATLIALGASQANAVTLDNSPGSGSISNFGVPDSQTYGEVLTAPITGTMTSFTLWLNGGVGSLEGSVGTWNGGPAFSFGNGSPSTLYTSGPQASTGTQSFTFTPNVSVTAGNEYVAFLSVFGDPNATTSTSMPLSSNFVSGIDYFVWNNSTSPYGNTSWNYFGDFGNAQFAATFTAAAVPEPASILLLGTTLIGFGLIRRRRKTA